MKNLSDAAITEAAAAARNWAKDTASDMRSMGRGMGVKGKSLNMLKSGVRMWSDTGLLRHIHFSMSRSLFFTIQGVGKDTPKSRAGTTNRKAKQFSRMAIDPNIETLATAISEVYGDALKKSIGDFDVVFK